VLAGEAAHGSALRGQTKYQVVLWLKTQMDSRVNVIVEL
jgi:hypothetical protein